MLDQDLLSEIQYAVLEPPDGGASWPAEVWDRDDVLVAVNDAATALVRDTGCRVTYLEQFVAAGALSVSLPDDWLATAHLVWRAMPDETRAILLPTDAFEADAGLAGWEGTPGVPFGYVDRDAQTLELRLVPTPSTHGTLENLYHPRPEPVEGNGQTIAVPEITISAVKYGALATLLGGVHRLQDPARAAYCTERVRVVVAVTNLLLQGGA